MSEAAPRASRRKRVGPGEGADPASAGASGRAPQPIPPAAEAFPFAIPPAVLRLLAKLEVRRLDDLVLHLPLRYEDETRCSPLAALPAGVPVQIEVEVVSAEVLFRPRRQLVVVAREAMPHAARPDAQIVLRFLNFYPSQQKQMESGRRLRVLGEARGGFWGVEMVHPQVRVVTADEPLPEALTPVYPTTAGLGQATLRRLIERALAAADLDDPLPSALLARLDLPAFAAAVRSLHHPPAGADLRPLAERSHPAWRRVKFDELLAQQLAMRHAYRRRRARSAPVLAGDGPLTRALLALLPFRLTGAQQRVWTEIRADLASPHPMQRLLQGDVGSGKTAVAALAAAQAIDAGYQAALMAPTEILAEQHFRKIADWFAELGVLTVMLTASLPPRDKRAAKRLVALGEAKLVVGTHALIQDGVAFPRLGLVIVDEQHRFGVRQRLALREKAVAAPAQAALQAPVDAASTPAAAESAPPLVPHQLMMSATPIPRTLAMSHYADLDVSVIDELPPGRTPVRTRLVSDARRDEVIARIRAACAAGRQAYWVCPLIEESDKLDLQPALDTFEHLRATFPDLRAGLIHGRLPADEKAAVMAAFSAGDIQLLVATTVIEVGVDVPNATLMVIEHAERFGLAQLHQLRGRVGRGAGESTCILLYGGPLSEAGRARLKIIFENTDGFEIARQDLLLRGPGELAGSRQSGVPLLRFADLTGDDDLLEAARQAADALLRDDPAAARRHLARWMGSRGELLKA